MPSTTTKNRPTTAHDPRRSVLEERAERIARERTRQDFPDAPGRYARLFRSALLQAVEEIGSTSSGSLTLAYSRAASRTWSMTRAHALDASRVRLQVFDEERARLRVDPLRAGLRPGSIAIADGDFVVPAPRPAVEDERPRRGGKR